MTKSYKNVIVSVKTIQDLGDEEPQIIDLTTEAKFYVKENYYYLTYDESEISELDENKVILKFNKNFIQMKRFGEFEHTMIFEKGKRHISNYHTPFGNFRIESLTNKIFSQISEAKGNMEIEYSISISGAAEMKNKLTITYRG